MICSHRRSEPGIGLYSFLQNDHHLLSLHEEYLLATIRTCVFCGKSPESKSLEHVIPRWLISMTGASDQRVTFGPDRDTKKIREYPFDQFKFPACISCNSSFSILEAEAKTVISALLNEEELTENSFATLLTWFDKVRVGLWLGYLMLDRNPFEIEPKFHISTRINTSDRLLLIYRASDTKPGLSFAGTFSPCFAHAPSCFGLRINQFFMVNLSDIGLFSRRLGLPFVKRRWWNDNMEIEATLTQGLGHIMLPLLRKQYDSTCTEIYQPIISPDFRSDEIIQSLYSNPYTSIFFPPNSFLGKVLILYRHKIVPYSKVPANSWVPAIDNKTDILKHVWTREVYRLQNFLIDNTFPDTAELEESEHKLLKSISAFQKRVNNLFISRIEEDLKKASRL
jgi:hypothetical protein